MIRFMYTLFFTCLMTSLFSQNVIADFETAQTSLTFQYFGSSLEPQLTTVEDNPNTVGNPSTKVMKYVKAANSQTWAGAFANPAIATPIDANVIGKICVDVHMDRIGNFSLKLEKNGGSDPDNYLQTVANTKINEWETLCFDLSLNSLEGNMTPGTGKIFPGFVIFPDFNTVYTEDVTYYFDNFLSFAKEPKKVVLLDFETTETGTDFQYFGSSLEPQKTTVIDNPDASGVNTSAKVIQYIKAANAQTWAGGFANPPIKTPIDGNIVTHVCVDVWMDHIGNLTLKLEKNGGNDPDNYINTIANTKVNEWETLCFDLSVPSFEGNMTPGTGKVFPGLVIFPDFGTPGGTEDETYYIDNFVLVQAEEGAPKPIAFQVDMNGYSGSFTTVYVSGTFNNWSGDSNPLSDANGDGIWEGEVLLDNGAYEFKFTLDNWTGQEQFRITDECVTVDPSGQFFNRSLLVSGEDTYGPVCFNSCYACGDEVLITFNLGIGGQNVPDTSGVYLAGGAQFGAPGGRYEMVDADGDNVYTIAIRRGKGYSTYYTFTNGNCPDFSCKEVIGGQPCARPENFNDRFLEAVTGNVTINTCYGECTDNTDCGPSSPKGKATFRVDMKNQTVTGNVYIAGQLINNWSPTATPMSDANGDGIYEYTMELPEGNVEYKFINGEDWETLENGSPCTITDPSGQFTNRLLVMGTQDTTLAVYRFGTCEIVSSVKDAIADDMWDVAPTLADQYINVRWTNLDVKEITILNLQGQRVKTYAAGLGQNAKTLDVLDMTQGMYFVSILTNDGRQATRKFVK